jgi:hypothetical protein
MRITRNINIKCTRTCYTKLDESITDHNTIINTSLQPAAVGAHRTCWLFLNDEGSLNVGIPPTPQKIFVVVGVAHEKL